LSVTGKIDGLVVTNLDRMDAFDEWKTCNRYQSFEERSNLEKYFDFDGQQVRNIQVPADPTDLARHEELTRLLYMMRPVYENHKKDANAYVESVSRILGLPIAITSFGPTALEKEPCAMPLSWIQKKALHAG
jgi:adenylosuccinate synthase